MTTRIKEILAAMESNGGAFATAAEISQIQVIAWQVRS